MLGDNYNAPVFHRCYKRMGELIPELLAEGKLPRIMLDYSGTLLHGCGGRGWMTCSTPCGRSPATRTCARPWSGWAAPGGTPWPPPPRCGTTGCTCGPGSTTEHTVELPDGRPLERPHLPHRLVCTSSAGDTAGMVAVVKTQGSDTKLVGQLQPYDEARACPAQSWPAARCRRWSPGSPTARTAG